MKRVYEALLIVILTLYINSSVAEDTLDNYWMIQQFTKDFRSSKLHNDLATCEFKVAWELLRDYGQIDDERFGANLAMNCVNLIQEASKILSPPIMMSVIFHNLGFVKKKVASDGIKAFQFYEDFEYSGEMKKDLKPKK